MTNQASLQNKHPLRRMQASTQDQASIHPGRHTAHHRPATHVSTGRGEQGRGSSLAGGAPAGWCCDV
jgi:hypothetical protein